MSGPVLDFDEVAADDALIESVRAGAVLDELPRDDAAASVLVSLRDGADVSSREAAPVIAEAGHAVVAGVVSYRRPIAASVVAGVLVTAGVGTAVAGDPTAAFTYIFRQGVEAGSRVGTPGGDVSNDSLGGIRQPTPAVGVSSVPVRQGMSAARSSDDGGDRDPMGFERDRRYWTVPTPRGLESISDGRTDSVGDADPMDGTHGYGDSQDIDPTTRMPEESESPAPEETTPSPDGNGAQTDPDETTDPPDEETTDPTDGGTTTLVTPPPEEETTTSPPEEDSTTPPPEETTTPPPEDDSTTPPPQTTTPPPPEDSPTESPSESPSQSESPSSPTDSAPPT